MNDFAKSQLMKYGWSEGKGLGKYESGITTILKPNLKFDTAGIGYKDKNYNNWWENAYNKAANSIIVKSHKHNVSISVSKKTTDDIQQKNLTKKKTQNNAKYENFIKTSKLRNGQLIEKEYVSNVKDAKEDIAYVPLTDAELFKICGERTAHTGARHGLTLSGKLNRIAQQDQFLLNRKSDVNISEMLANNNSHLEEEEAEIFNNENNTIYMMFPTDKSEAITVSKSTKRKNKRRINDLSHQLNVLCYVSSNDEKNIQLKEKILKQEKIGKKIRRRRMKRRSSISCDVENVEKQEVDNESGLSFSMNPQLEEEPNGQHIPEKLLNHESKKLNDLYTHVKRKKKKQRCNECIDVTVEESVGKLYRFKKKKFKKRCKNDPDLKNPIEHEKIDVINSNFQQVLSFNEVPHKSKKKMNSSTPAAKPVLEVTEAYLKQKTDHLNNKIKKKKLTKLKKKQKLLFSITENLKVVKLESEEINKKN